VKGFRSISIREFLGKEDGPDRKAELAFDILDKDKDGFISKTEYMAVSDKLGKKQVSAVFARNDADGDGKLSREEYLAMVRPHSSSIKK